MWKGNKQEERELVHLRGQRRNRLPLTNALSLLGLPDAYSRKCLGPSPTQAPNQIVWFLATNRSLMDYWDNRLRWPPGQFLFPPTPVGMYGRNSWLINTANPVLNPTYTTLLPQGSCATSPCPGSACQPLRSEHSLIIFPLSPNPVESSKPGMGTGASCTTQLMTSFTPDTRA